MNNFLLNIIYKLHSITYSSSARQLELSYRISLNDYKTNIVCLTEGEDNCQDKLFVLPNGLESLQDIQFVLPNALCQDNQFVWPKPCDACKTILNCLAECLLPRQSKIVWPNGFCKTIAIVLPKFLIVWPNEDCLTEALNCLTSSKIVFLLCLVLARQSEIVLPLPLCLCYLQLSCLSIVLQVQMLCL